MKPKKELIRIVKTSDGEIKLDFTGRINGRGAYICHDIKCLEKAKKSRRLEKAFSCAVSQEIYEVMANELSDKIL